MAARRQQRRQISANPLPALTPVLKDFVGEMAAFEDEFRLPGLATALREAAALRRLAVVAFAVVDRALFEANERDPNGSAEMTLTLHQLPAAMRLRVVNGRRPR